MKLFKILAISVALAASGAMAEDARQIVVTGEGTVQAAPDMATVTIGVTREARAAGEALRLTSEAASGVLERLAAEGIEPRDIQTLNVSLSPNYQHTNDGRPPRIAGYIASNDLSVRVRDLGKLGGVLDAVVADGANAMNGIFFAVADPAPLEEAARRAAVADAKARAEVLAEAAGVALGGVISIIEGGGFAGPVPMAKTTIMEAAVPIAGGEVGVGINVTVVYSIAE